MNLKRLLLTCIVSSMCMMIYAQPPVGTGSYYSAADGLCGEELKTAMWNIIKNPDVDGYSALWADYSLTDMTPDGYVWDMYSYTYYYTNFDKKDQKSEGSGLNREHSMPKSWFNSAEVEKELMYSDIVHVIPVDGWINNKRSNWPYGETNKTGTFKGDFSKLGASSLSDYKNKTVFEPNDLYKGDLARIYFYMITCYEDQVANWSCDMFSNDSYTGFATWAMNMLMRWSGKDLVSQKEMDRNHKCFTIQFNRNPFVDYPGLEQYIWGELKTKPFSYDHYEVPDGLNGDTPTEEYYALILHAPFFGSLDDFQINDVNKGGLKNDIWTPTVEYGMKATAFTSAGERPTESWLISPVIDLTMSRDVVLEFQHAGKFFGDMNSEATLWVREEGGQWEQIPINQYFTNSSWTFKTNKTSLSDYEGKSIQLGFCYKSTASNAGTWEIKNLKITGWVTDTSTNIFETPVQLVREDGYTYNLAGQRVDNPTERGIYIRNGKKFVVR